MKKLFAIIPFIFSSYLFANEDVVALVDLKFKKNTGDVAVWMCYDEKEEDCHPWAYTYLFQAKVKKVVSGNLSGKKIKVLYGRHALPPVDYKNVPVILTKLKDSDKADYQIRSWGMQISTYCFANYNQETDIKMEMDNRSYSCFEKE